MARKKITTIPFHLVELEDENYHIIIDSKLGNGIAGNWVVDTGASKTVFDVNQSEHFNFIEIDNTEVQSAGIGEGSIDTKVGVLPYLKIGDIVLENFTAAIIDMKYINKIYSKFSDFVLVGLIGSDFLVQHDAIINYKKKEIKLYF